MEQYENMTVAELQAHYFELTGKATRATKRETLIQLIISASKTEQSVEDVEEDNDDDTENFSPASQPEFTSSDLNPLSLKREEQVRVVPKPKVRCSKFKPNVDTTVFLNGVTYECVKDKVCIIPSSCAMSLQRNGNGFIIGDAN
jgi:hypothetical protein